MLHGGYIANNTGNKYIVHISNSPSVDLKNVTIRGNSVALLAATSAAIMYIGGTLKVSIAEVTFEYNLGTAMTIIEPEYYMYTRLSITGNVMFLGNTGITGRCFISL